MLWPNSAWTSPTSFLTYACLLYFKEWYEELEWEKGKILLWRRWKKDLKQPSLAPSHSLFGLLISQSPPVCITVPDSKIAVLGSHHFELPSLSFSSHISKPLEAPPWTFLTSQQLLMSSENSLKTWKQALLPLTATCNHSNTLPWACSEHRNPLKVSKHAALPNPCHLLPSLWAGGSSLLYLSDTHFAQGAGVNGLVTEQRSNNIFILHAKKFLFGLSSVWYHFSIWDWKPWVQGSFFSLPIISQSIVSNSKSQDTL